jgi:hypothetical protein
MDLIAPPPVVPLQMLAGSSRFSAGDEAYTLLGQPSHGKNRVFVAKVVFETSFTRAPIVHVGLTGFDISNADWARIDVRVGAISAYDFEVIAETWFNTQIHSFRVGWLALA